uniref:Uncharacterized protein n=1 Tax=Chromera velia CCMP2878 TaxID=1169474 RepID=A0A0G4FKU6_9ALVE|mmetsp:Transcript_23908/g.46954  ORF Transcript_23908/g.46954 Transcript_23908/m.46954 type:complete len:283 (-) Transcript_23908:269-1117(-)|eukprot:Cvel_17532.t1-p1 / transcript=Cvel_17532.t1 / gene=Cvel_17532 / organism=Chromera_velia_CCMP2878 / gene_product=Putative ankyrin repeat protein RF_0381, putative / transcript_product=Putative ankyrin repeat protein RF_0381, putative / location=Cvel_scaffold1406:10271-14753(+) / protein_length=282 / sequence_SO=supercontig / SO=protein_coding / is_pseudo=false
MASPKESFAPLAQKTESTLPDSEDVYCEGKSASSLRLDEEHLALLSGGADLSIKLQVKVIRELEATPMLLQLLLSKSATEEKVAVLQSIASSAGCPQCRRKASPLQQRSRDSVGSTASASGLISMGHSQTSAAVAAAAVKASSPRPNLEEEVEGGIAPLCDAAERGDFERVRELLISDEDIDVSQCDILGRTALHWTAFWGAEAETSLLLGRGANVNARNDDQNTPLHVAAHKGQVAVASILLESGADVNARNCYGETPLAVAQEWERHDVASLLVEHGGKV